MNALIKNFELAPGGIAPPDISVSLMIANPNEEDVRMLRHLWASQEVFMITVDHPRHLPDEEANA